MNKIQVGLVASPNIKDVKPRIGSLANTGYRPGGGSVKIESRRLDTSSVAPRIQAKSDHRPGGGNKKIVLQKLEWKGQPKVGSLANTKHRAGGGNVQVETQRLDFRQRAASKVGSRDNIHHKPGGGDVKVESRRHHLSAVSSKVGSLENVGHRPRDSEKRIFDDTAYLRQLRSLSAEGRPRHLSLASKSADSSVEGASDRSPGPPSRARLAARSPSRSRKSPAPDGKSPMPTRKSQAPNGNSPTPRRKSQVPDGKSPTPRRKSQAPPDRAPAERRSSGPSAEGKSPAPGGKSERSNKSPTSLDNSDLPVLNGIAPMSQS